MQSLPTFVIAHPYPAERVIISQSLREQEHNLVEVTCWSELLWVLAKHEDLELLLLDLTLLDGHAFENLRYLFKHHAKLKVVAINHRSRYIPACKLLDLGIRAVLTSTETEETLSEVIGKVCAGQNVVPELVTEERYEKQPKVLALSDREQRVLNEIHKGLLNKQIAYELKISLATTKVHICSIYRKLKVKNRTQAILVSQAQNQAKELVRYSLN